MTPQEQYGDALCLRACLPLTSVWGNSLQWKINVVSRKKVKWFNSDSLWTWFLFKLSCWSLDQVDSSRSFTDDEISKAAFMFFFNLETISKLFHFEGTSSLTYCFFSPHLSWQQASCNVVFSELESVSNSFQCQIARRLLFYFTGSTE